MLYVFTLHWYRTKEENTLPDGNKLKTVSRLGIGTSKPNNLTASEAGKSRVSVTLRSWVGQFWPQYQEPKELLLGPSGFTTTPYHVWSDDHW